jgi:hypothetical protein
MQKLLYFIALALLAGCTIKTVDPSSPSSGGNPVNTTTQPCQANRFGWFRFSNDSNNPYDVYIDGVYWGRVSGKKISDQAKANSGTYKLYAKQVSGYLLYATERNQTVTLGSCKEYTWEFP